MTARTRLLAPLAALAVSAAALAGCGTEDDPEASDPNPPAQSSPTSAATTPAAQTGSPTATASASDPQPTGGAGQVAVPLYFVGDTPLGARLYREFQDVGADDPMLEALARLAAGEAQDPDYGTALPAGGGFASVEYDGTAVVVGLADDTWVAKPAGMTARQAKLAAQQVVYTLQGIQQDRVPVKVTGPDGQPSTFLGFDTSAGLQAAGQSAVLALVNVTEPAEGAAVSGTFTASGVANSFEATVPWHVEDQSGATVLEGFATAEGWADKLYPWQAQVDVSGLAPGTYTFVATTDDASDGEGAGPTRDTKTITVS